MDEPLIERAEVVAFLANVSEIAAAVSRLDDRSSRARARSRLTEAERAERKAARDEMLANAARTRDLAQRAQARLDANTRRQ